MKYELRKNTRNNTCQVCGKIDNPKIFVNVVIKIDGKRNDHNPVCKEHLQQFLIENGLSS